LRHFPFRCFFPSNMSRLSPFQTLFYLYKRYTTGTVFRLPLGPPSPFYLEHLSIARRFFLTSLNMRHVRRRLNGPVTFLLSNPISVSSRLSVTFFPIPLLVTALPPPRISEPSHFPPRTFRPGLEPTLGRLRGLFPPPRFCSLPGRPEPQSDPVSSPPTSCRPPGVFSLAGLYLPLAWLASAHVCVLSPVFPGPIFTPNTERLAFFGRGGSRGFEVKSLRPQSPPDVVHARIFPWSSPCGFFFWVRRLRRDLRRPVFCVWFLEALGNSPIPPVASCLFYFYPSRTTYAFFFFFGNPFLPFASL